MALNPIRALRDFSKTAQAARELYAAVTYAHKQHKCGIDVPNNDPEMAVAVMKMMAKHPELIIVKNKKNLTVAFREDFAPTVSADLHETMKKDGFIATPGEDLT